MSKDQLGVAVCQMTSIDSVSSNLAQIEARLRETGRLTDLDLICFPENSLYMRLKEGAAIPGISLEDKAFTAISKFAVTQQVHIHLGSVPLAEGKKVSNCSVLIEPSGHVHSTYRKMHLFDVELDGEKVIRESDVFRPGAELSVFEVHGWKLAETICYDLRFSELYAQYVAKHQPDIFLIPSAFTVPTGQAHWSVLLRARAIEAQAYVLAAAQGGQHSSDNGQKSTYGHSHIIDPWGEVLATATKDQPMIFARLSKQSIQRVKKQIPMASHRKLSPYH